jgi:REP element-mobilizing transposase RayT
MQPVYTSANCTPAYQLRWSLALFAKVALPRVEDWLAELKTSVERDGVRILEHHCRGPTVWQFLISTQPHVAPPEIVKSVKGRLQTLVRSSHPRAFRRNFSLASVGDARQQVVEAYVAGQLGHHRMADEAVQQRLAKFQLHLPQADLAEQFSSHGRYVYNLHLVLVHEARWRDVDEQRLATTRDMVLKVAGKKQHRLSRASLLADHLHITLGCPLDAAPEEVALAYLNNLAYGHGMQALYRHGYYVGTFGSYDMGAIRRSVAS